MNGLTLFKSLVFIQALQNTYTVIEIIYNFYTAVFNHNTHRNKLISRLQFLITVAQIYLSDNTIYTI